MIYQLETIIAKSNNKMSAHNVKWGKYKVPLLYVYVRKDCLQCKKDDEEVYVYVSVVSVVG